MRRVQLNAWIVPFSIFVFTLLFFFANTPTTLVGYADSAELAAVGRHGGLAHPPGYVLYTQLLWLLTQLKPPMLLLASWLHMLSGLFSASTCLVAYILIRKLLMGSGVSNISSTIGGVLGVGSLLYSQAFVEYSLITEVFSLHMLLTILVVNGYFSLYASGSSQNWRWWWLLVGVYISHHQLSWLVVIGLVVSHYLHVSSKKQQVFISWLSYGLVGLSVFVITGLLTYVVSQRAALISWSMDSGLEGLISFLFRGDYGEGASAYISAISVEQVLGGVVNAYQYLIGELGLYFGLSLLGASWLVRSAKKQILRPMVLWFFAALFPALILYVPTQLQSVADFELVAMTERMFLGILPVMAVFSGLSMAVIGRRPYVVFSIIAFIGWSMHHSIYQNPTVIAIREAPMDTWSRLVDDVITSEDRLLCFGDITCFPLLYLYSEDTELYSRLTPLTPRLGERPDTISRLPNAWQVLELLASSLHSTDGSVYVTELDPEFVQFAGLDGQNAYLLPRYPVYEIACATDGYVPLDYAYSGPELLENPSPYQLVFRQFFAWNHGLHAQLLARLGYVEVARLHIQDGLELTPDLPFLLQLDQNIDNFNPNNAYGENRCLNIEDRLELLEQCVATTTTCPTQLLTGLVLAAPEDPRTRSLLYDYFVLAEETELADFQLTKLSDEITQI